RPGSRDVVGVPTGARRLAGEAVARQGRDHDVESVLGAASVSGWIRERTDDLELLDDGSRPTVRDDHRKRILVTRTDVYEVNVDSVYPSHELRKGVELRLRLPPVVVRLPVARQLFHCRQLRALRPISDRLLVGPACRRQASTEVDERLFRNLDAKGADRLIFSRCRRLCRKRVADRVLRDGAPTGLGVALNGEQENAKSARDCYVAKKAAPGGR